jgi:hypothetical protein
MPVQIRLSLLMPIRIGSGSYLKLYSSVRIFLLFSQQCQFPLFYLSHQCQMCHNFQYLDIILNFLEKVYLVYLYIWLKWIRTHPDPA